MGKNEAASPSKSDKASSPVQEQPHIHPYPDWAAMQAYYGAGITMAPPYFGTAVAPGHAPHPCMWRPQPLVTPFGTPYAAIYPPGVYSHPSVPLGSHAHCQGIAPSPTTAEALLMATSANVETPAKSPNNKDRGLLEKLKGLDVHVSVSDGNADNTARDATDGPSQSGESGGEGPIDGSAGNNELRSKIQRKSSEGMLLSGKDGKAKTLASATHGGEVNGTSNLSLGMTVPPANTTEKLIGSIPSSGPTPGMGLRVSTTREVKIGVAPVTPPANAMVRSRGGVPHELWIQDERELKREKRKQSNRESARRSRLRRQAETEEHAMKVEILTAENTTLRSEINRLIENSEKLRQENTALMEKLQKTQLNQVKEMPPEADEPEGLTSIGTQNFLSKVNNSSSPNNSGGQHNNLHQLLGASTRTDSIAAG